MKKKPLCGGQRGLKERKKKNNLVDTGFIRLLIKIIANNDIFSSFIQLKLIIHGCITDIIICNYLS